MTVQPNKANRTDKIKFEKLASEYITSNCDNAVFAKQRLFSLINDDLYLHLERTSNIVDMLDMSCDYTFFEPKTGVLQDYDLYWLELMAFMSLVPACSDHCVGGDLLTEWKTSQPDSYMEVGRAWDYLVKNPFKQHTAMTGYPFLAEFVHRKKLEIVIKKTRTTFYTRRILYGIMDRYRNISDVSKGLLLMTMSKKVSEACRLKKAQEIFAAIKIKADVPEIVPIPLAEAYPLALPSMAVQPGSLLKIKEKKKRKRARNANACTDGLNYFTAEEIEIRKGKATLN